LDDHVKSLLQRYPSERIFITGFGHGALLAEAYFSRTSLKLGGLVSIGGSPQAITEKTPSIFLKEMPQSREEGRRLHAFFGNYLWLRNLALEKMADRVVGIEAV
jgi:dienelactone hydrolase